MSRSPRAAEALLSRLEWTVLKRLDGLLHGDYRTLFRGFGMDLADLREYLPGDDVRYIDWNVTARTDTPHIRQYHEDREVTAWFLLDLSPSIDFGSTTADKRDLVVDFVGAMARLLTHHGNRIGAIFYGGGIDGVVPARGGRTHVLNLINRLLETPRLESSVPTSLGDLLSAADRYIRRRSLIFLVSDFYSEDGWVRSLGTLARRHEVLGVRVFDPLETELPDLGMIMVSDSETGEQLLVDTHDRGFRDRFARAAETHERILREGMAAAGVDGVELSTRDDLVESLVRYAAMRKSLGGTRS